MKQLYTGISIGIVSIIIFLYSILFIAHHVMLPGDLARIEQLRVDVGRTTNVNSEDVIGQVTKWNQKISSAKAYNKLWWAGPIIPDTWDTVELISIPL